jgi:hypothetical protein
MLIIYYYSIMYYNTYRNAYQVIKHSSRLLCLRVLTPLLFIRNFIRKTDNTSIVKKWKAEKHREETREKKELKDTCLQG